MNLKYLRVDVFSALKRPFSDRSRLGRMRSYAAIMGLREGMSIIDLGGTPAIWASVSPHLDLTILNLPGGIQRASSHHKIRYVEGDACQVQEFQERTFDSVFSNSVIEHVGPAHKQAAFAHCGMPFWWFYPAQLRRYFIQRWRKKLPAWTHMVEETTVLDKTTMQQLFPEATILTEKSLGIPKSYIAYFTGLNSAS